ncbi:hypothetical protein OG497_39590 [Streptomyces sp. NBC_01242]|uniref:hypothetical protein n=1 Tax=Streptomyces sp. NBC_01242 TaxID=2903795 RepID=UPI002259F2F4|nr:hypothetical protein [Streptomyces sp. NBC_01242]MCX4799948.1 hypothetical protein [Streptomyces sp. NBC_01242]
MTTTPSQGQAVPVPVRVVLPDGQELTARLWARRETSRGWLYEVGLPSSMRDRTDKPGAGSGFGFSGMGRAVHNRHALVEGAGVAAPGERQQAAGE